MILLPTCIADALTQKYGVEHPEPTSSTHVSSFDGCTRPEGAIEVTEEELTTLVCPKDRMPPLPLMESAPLTHHVDHRRTVEDVTWIRYETIPTLLRRISVAVPDECVCIGNGNTYRARSIYGYDLGTTNDRRIAAVLVRIDALDSTVPPSVTLGTVSRCGRAFRSWWNRVCIDL